MFSNLRAKLFKRSLNKFLSTNNFEFISTINRGDSHGADLDDIKHLYNIEERFLRFIVVDKSSNNNGTKYFVKIPLYRKGRKELKKQIKITNFLTETLNVHTPKILNSKLSLIPSHSYAVFEYLPLDTEEGFYYNAELGTEHSRIKYKRLTDSHLRLLIEELYDLACSPRKKVLPEMKKIKNHDYTSNVAQYSKLLEKKVKPVEMQPNELKLSELFSEKLGISNFGVFFFEYLDSLEKEISSYEDPKNYYLVHGDCDLNNVYFHSESKLSFIDLEFLGYSHSPLLSFVYDYSNLRARQYADKDFRYSLDKIMLGYFEEIGKKEMGELALKLAIIKKSLEFSYFHENYSYDKQNLEYKKIEKQRSIDDLKLVFVLN